MDALVVAAADEKTLNTMTRRYQQMDRNGQSERLPNIEAPWSDFVDDAIATLNGEWLVCRTENRRVRGAGHEETIRRAALEDGEPKKFFERKKVEALTKDDLERIPQPGRDDSKILEQHENLLAALRTFVNREPKAASPEDAIWPRSFQGDVIRKIRLETKDKALRKINPKHFGGTRKNRAGGFVKNADMTRVDVYRVAEDTTDADGRKVTKGYYLVPVYNWQLVDKSIPTPMRAIASGREQGAWPEMKREDFLFSFFKDSYVTVTPSQKNKSAAEGYFRQASINTAAIKLSRHCIRDITKPEFASSIKTVRQVQKFTVDRLGRKHEIKREKWPGRER